MKIGFIDYYLDEWHANNYPKFIHDASNGEMEVTLAFGLIDSPITDRRTTDEWCRDMGIPKADSIEQVCAECDAIIVLSPDNCEMHEQLCQLPLRTGKPVYVDKTFAPDYSTAKRIFDIAEASGTPCYSSSALRFADEYRGLSEVESLASWGPNAFETYSIHQLEPIMMLIKSKPVKVCYIPGRDSYTLEIVFEDGRTASLHGVEAGGEFMMNVVKDFKQSVITVCSDYFHNFIVSMVDFFRTAKPVVPHSETLNIMAVRGAGIEAIKRPCEWISL